MNYDYSTTMSLNAMELSIISNPNFAINYWSGYKYSKRKLSQIRQLMKDSLNA